MKGINNSDVNAMQKVLTKQGADFAEKIKEAFKNPAVECDARHTFTAEGPAKFLCLDQELSKKVQLADAARHPDRKKVGACVFDREYFASRRGLSS